MLISMPPICPIYLQQKHCLYFSDYILRYWHYKKINKYPNQKKRQLTKHIKIQLKKNAYSQGNIFTAALRSPAHREGCYYSLQNCTVLYCRSEHCSIQQVLYFTLVYCHVQQVTILYSGVLYWIVQKSTVTNYKWTVTSCTKHCSTQQSCTVQELTLS